MDTTAIVLASPVTETVPEWARVPGVEFLLAVAVLAGGVWLSKLLVRLLGRPVARRFHRQSVAQTVLRGVRVTTVITALFLAGWVAGLGLPDLVLSVTVFSAVVGVVLAPLIGNVINGLFVLADQPFEIGDMIELDDGRRGFVEDITIRYTKVITLDNTFLVIPNSNTRERDITNYSAEDERTRLTLELLVTYECDVDEARRLMERAARDCEGVIDGGPDIRIGTARYVASPDCRLAEYGDDGILLQLRYWAKKPYKIHKLQSQVNSRIWELIADADVEVAYPHRHLVFDETSGVARVGAPIDDDASLDADGPVAPDAVADAEGTADSG
ncbi:mechanosensitive ion channel family protein [Halopenitus persicus]|uniref:Small-conductance mechanosensitive channel n=1 Tax=Halopenitus persicus TaxID=1048396 RepID=A0A1H3N319_9EURY|nr:mechanosensitive ion channel family protein [Halopenitus persicus]QHS17745.1 mechanosensitive ion channel family protein [haloarchaeon 3A1-DGR]SDY82639.1 Small-conductance mechanosensitive channel [Halopenitus persicus]